MTKKMFWGVDPSVEEDFCALVAAGKPRMALQQNLGSDRMSLADSINSLHGGIQAKRDLLNEKMLAYQEHHNDYMEKQADLIATADAPANIDLEGKVSGWDRLAADNASKRTKHKLDHVESATINQLGHAKEMLDSLKGHQKANQSAHNAMDGFASGHADFEEAVSHSRHLSQKEIDKAHAMVSSHIADHKRFLTRIANVRRKV